MKKLSIIIGLLGFFAISCATTTANTDQRKVLSIQEHGTKVSAVKQKSPASAIQEANSYYDSCLSNCTEKEGGLLIFCSDSCLKITKSKKGKAKLILADYSTCLQSCKKDGHPAEDCSDACGEGPSKH